MPVPFSNIHWAFHNDKLCRFAKEKTGNIQTNLDNISKWRENKNVPRHIQRTFLSVPLIKLEISTITFTSCFLKQFTPLSGTLKYTDTIFHDFHDFFYNFIQKWHIDSQDWCTKVTEPNSFRYCSFGAYANLPASTMSTCLPFIQFIDSQHVITCVITCALPM